MKVPYGCPDHTGDEAGDGMGAPGFVDVHTHAIAPDLAVPSAAEGHDWPWVRRESETTAAIHVGSRRYRTIDERC